MVILQPAASPMARPRGRPAIMAMDEPATMMLRAMEPLPFGAILTASGVTIDQNMAWEQATPMRESISM